MTAFSSRKGRSKFGNVRTKVDGISFASKAEAARYQELKLLEKAGKIAVLTLQPRYSLESGGKTICTYVADFEYFLTPADGSRRKVTEDVKGIETAVFKLKRKLFEAQYWPLTIVRGRA